MAPATSCASAKTAEIDRKARLDRAIGGGKYLHQFRHGRRIDRHRQRANGREERAKGGGAARSHLRFCHGKSGGWPTTGSGIEIDFGPDHNAPHDKNKVGTVGEFDEPSSENHRERMRIASSGTDAAGRECLDTPRGSSRGGPLRNSSARAKGWRKGVSRWPTLKRSGREIEEFAGDDVDHLAFPLEAAGHAKHASPQHDAAEPVENLRPDHEIGDAGFILDGDEDHPLGRARTLAHQNKARRLHPAAIGAGDGIPARNETSLAQVFPQGRRADGRAASARHDRNPLHHLAARPSSGAAQSPARHCSGKSGGLPFGCGGKERQRLIPQPLQRPERCASRKTEVRLEGIGTGKRFHGAGGKPHPAARDRRWSDRGR